MSFDALELASHDLDARYSGLLAPKKVHGRLEVTARDLSRFAGLAGGALKGQARGTAELDGAPSYGALTATIDAEATRLATAYPLLDRVTGGELHVTGAARSTAGGGFGFSDLTASGAHGSARLNGDFGRDKANLEARVDLPQASALDPRVSGRVQALATLTGPPDDLSGTVKATLGEGQLLDRRAAGLTLNATASHITGLLDAKAALSGDVDGHPLQASAHVAKTAEGGWAADTVALSLASARLAGAVTVGADNLATGELSFGASNLDDLSPLVLTKMSGALQAKVSASAAGGKQALAVIASSDRMAFGTSRLDGLKVDLKVGDLWRARDISGLATLSRAEIAGQSVSDIRLAAKGQADSTDLSLDGDVRGLAVKAQGRLTGGAPVRLDLARFTAQGAGRTIALAGPATLTYGKDGLAIQNFALRVDSGRLALSGRAGRDARSARERDRDAAGRARSRLARPRPFRNRRRRRDDPGRAGRSRRRLAASPATSQRAADAEQRVAAARRDRLRPACRRANLGRSHSERGRRQFRPRCRIGAAVERRRARSEDRREARRRPRQPRPVSLGAPHDRSGHARRPGARDRRQAAGARVDPSRRWRVPRRPDGVQAHRNDRRHRRQWRYGPHPEPDRLDAG